MSSIDFSITAISNINTFSVFEPIWDAFLDNYSENPFFLSGFIKQYMINCLKGWIPLILIVFANNKPVCLAPLKMKKKLGIHSVQNLIHPDLSPALINNQYREDCISQILNYLLKTLRCRFIDLVLPADSPNIQILEQQCKTNKIYYSIKPGTSHSILPVEYSWDEFKTLREKNKRTRKKLNRVLQIERKMKSAGSWKITCADLDEKSDTIKKILQVEKMSWKEEWRTQKNISTDQDLMVCLNGSNDLAGRNPYFKPKIFFLELDGKPIAYELVLQYKEYAFLVKTSFDNRFRQYYPGILLEYQVLRQLFNEKKVKSVDYLTENSTDKTWTDLHLSRVKFMMRRGFISKAYTEIAESLRSLWQRIRGKIPEKIEKQ